LQHLLIERIFTSGFRKEIEVFQLPLSLQKMLRISRLVIADFLANGFDNLIEAAGAQCRVFVEVGFVVVELIVYPVDHGCEVGHHYIGSGQQAALPAKRVEGFQGCGRSHIDIGHQKAQRGKHQQAHPESFGSRPQ